MKKVLVTASTASMIRGFNMPNIHILQKLGYEVSIACNFHNENPLTEEQSAEFTAELDRLGVRHHGIDFPRSPFKVRRLAAAYRELKKLVAGGQYDLVHCHSPVGGILTRLAARGCRRKGTKVIYTAHGFHFYKGAPAVNWILYFPVEWLCSFWTDLLVTINKEDYAFARKHLHAKRTEYVPGVGIDMKKFSPGTLSTVEREALRAELRVGPGDRMLLSVGELNRNKNHGMVIRAMAGLNDGKLHYVVAGDGGLRGYLEELAGSLGLEGRVHLLGFRRDVAKLYQAADLYIHPSLREGLPVSVMEAIASGCPVICSDIRGNRDLVGAGALFPPADCLRAAGKIREYLSGDSSEERDRNLANLKKFDIEEVAALMERLYTGAAS